MQSGDGIDRHLQRNHVIALALIVASVLIFCSVVDTTPLFGDNNPPTAQPITFDPNGGTVAHTGIGGTDSDPYVPLAYDSHYIPGNEFIIESDTYSYSRDHYSFLGWAKSPNAINPDYVEGNVASVSDLSSSSYTLYAVWKANMYEVVLHFDNEHQATITMPYEGKFDTSSYIDSYTAPDGYRVVGWSVTELNKSGNVYVIPKDPQNPTEYVKTYSHIITLESEGVTLYPILALYKNLTSAALTITDNGCYFVTGGSPFLNGEGGAGVSSNAIIVGDGNNTISPFIFAKSLYMDFTDTGNNDNQSRSPMKIMNRATATLVVIDECQLMGKSDTALGTDKKGYAGINVQSGGTLVISENCTGTLYAVGGSTELAGEGSWISWLVTIKAHSAAGIGGNANSNGVEACGTIIINGGTVYATGGSTSTKSYIVNQAHNNNMTSGPGIGGSSSTIEINGGTVYATSGQVYNEDRNGNKQLYSEGNDLYPLYGDNDIPISEDAIVIINGRDDSEIYSEFTPVTLTISTSTAINPASSIMIGNISINIDGMVIQNGSKLSISPELFKDENDSLVNSITVAVIDKNTGYYYSGPANKDNNGNYSVTISLRNGVYHGTVTIKRGDNYDQNPVQDSNDFGYITPYQTYTIQSEEDSQVGIFYIGLSPGYQLNDVYIRLNGGGWTKQNLVIDQNSRTHEIHLTLTLAASGNRADNEIAFDIQRKEQTVTITNEMFRGDSDFTSSLITSSVNDPAITFDGTDTFTQTVYYGDSRTYTIHLYKDANGNPVRLMMITKNGVEIEYTDNEDNTYTFTLNGIENDCNIDIVYSRTVKVRANQATIHPDQGADIPVSVTLVNADGTAINQLVWYDNGDAVNGLIWDSGYCYAYLDYNSSAYFQLGSYDRINYGVSNIGITYGNTSVTLGSTANDFYAIPSLSANTTINVTMDNNTIDVEFESEEETRLLRVVSGSIIVVPDVGEFSSINLTKSGNNYVISTSLPLKEGYDIDYWLVEDAEYKPGSQIRVMSPVHLTVVWKENARSYTITYDLDGGNFEIGYENPTSYDIDSDFVIDNTEHGPVKTGYTFDGWIGSNGNVAQKTITIDGSAMAENLSYVAKWTPVQVTVTYRDELKGINLGSHTYEYGKEYTGLPICNNFNDVDHNTVYTFAGWATSYENEVYGEKITNTTKITNPANHTIYVIWIPNGLYIINILDNGNGGTVIPSINMGADDAEVTLTITPFAGYDSTSLYINGTRMNDYGAGSTSYSFNIEPPNNGYVISIRVVFEHVRQTIYLHHGVTPAEQENPTEIYYYVDSDPIMITRSEVGTYDGYRFIGWKWQVDGEWYSETEYILIPTGTVGDFHYYEEWQRIIYTVSYELYDVGQNSPNNPETYISGYTVILEDPTSEVYTFVGWYLDENFENGPIHEISSNMSGDITLYAKWLKIRVFFDPNGGTGEEMEPLQGAPTDQVLLPDCDYYYEGRLFIEWNTVLDGSGTPYAPGQTITLGNSDVRLYAIWYIIVTKPSAIQNHTYDGVTVIITADTGYSVSGATSATYWREGGYTTTFELADGYVWDDYTYNPIICNWQIMKRTAFIAANSYYVRHGSSTNDAPSYYTLGLVSGDFTIAPGDVDTDAIGSFRNAITYQVSNARSAFAQQIMGSYDLVIIDGYVIVYDEDSSTVAVDIVNGSRSLSMQMGLSAPRMMAVPNRRFV